MEKRIINSSLQLDCYLCDLFKDRIETDFLTAAKGGVSGTLDEKAFNITFGPNKYALISMKKEDDSELRELVEALSKVMDSEPICSYDLKTEDVDFAVPTFEWDIKDPEGRIKEVVNGRAFSDKSQILNLELYGNRRIEDYVETKEEQEDRIKNARIYGIDPGKGTDVEAVNNLSEIDLYFAIDAMGAFFGE